MFPVLGRKIIELIAQQGRIGGVVNYVVEVAMLGYKVVIGRTLRARTLSTQKVDAKDWREVDVSSLARSYSCCRG
jgi:hypothetical protein